MKTDSVTPESDLGAGSSPSPLLGSFEDPETTALHEAIKRAANSDLEGSPYPEGDRIYLYLSHVAVHSLAAELVESLHELGFAIKPNAERTGGKSGAVTG